jgi:transcriptional regulator with XRE-family HTH domain
LTGEINVANNTGEIPAHQNLGYRLRELREARALSLEELALASNLTKGYLSKVERNIATPTTAALLRICQQLGISLGKLVETSSLVDVVHYNERPHISLGGHNIKETLLTPTGERRLQVIHTVIGPLGGSGSEEYSLPSDVEFATVLRGVIELHVSSTIHVLREGDSITFSSQEYHSFVNPKTDEVAEILWVITPALPDDFQVINNPN